jgi:DNA-binding CsgD family transcriptional regulator
MPANSLIDLLDHVGDVHDFGTGETFLHAMQKLYEVKHIAYLCNNLPRPTHEGYYLHHSYSDAWARHYEQSGFILVDPVVRAGFTTIVPSDWRGLTGLTSRQRTFFEEARVFGVGRQGLTVSIRGLHRETAIFSINTDHTDVEWTRYKLEYMRDLQIVATFFHERIARSQGRLPDDGIRRLSPRELECLKWCAAGKTFADIGDILGISERTVHFHLTLCRHKLGALTNPQAVARAIGLGLIAP